MHPLLSSVGPKDNSQLESITKDDHYRTQLGHSDSPFWHLIRQTLEMTSPDKLVTPQSLTVARHQLWYQDWYLVMIGYRSLARASPTLTRSYVGNAGLFNCVTVLVKTHQGYIPVEDCTTPSSVLVITYQVPVPGMIGSHTIPVTGLR